MARLSRKAEPQSGRSINPITRLPRRIRVPRELRTVSFTGHVPSVTLTGAWLENVGFFRGARFLVLVDDSQQILLARID
jgi:hypothetical protein